MKNNDINLKVNVDMKELKKRKKEQIIIGDKDDRFSFTYITANR